MPLTMAEFSAEMRAHPPDNFKRATRYGIYKPRQDIFGGEKIMAKKPAKKTAARKAPRSKTDKTNVFVIPHPKKDGRWSLKYWGAQTTFRSFDDREDAANYAMAMPGVTEISKFDARGEVTSIMQRTWRKLRVPPKA